MGWLLLLSLLTSLALYYLGRYDLPRDYGWQAIRGGTRQKQRWLKHERSLTPIKLDT